MAAKERYIDAEELIKKITEMYVGMPTIAIPYSGLGSNSLDTAVANFINSQVVSAVNSALFSFKQQLTTAIEASATLKGTPCFLCKQRDGEELPERVDFGCGKASAV